MKPGILLMGAAALAAGLMTACSGREPAIKRFSGDSLNGLIQVSGVALDSRVKTEGKGSLRVELTEPAVVHLYETGDIDIEAATLVYLAKIKTEDVKGRVYLEMGCHFQDKGEFFSRGLDAPLSGTNNWAAVEIPFFLKAGENPDNVKLNIVGEGTGTIWVDDIRLVKRPL
jgi:hypothetical protein